MAMRKGEISSDEAAYLSDCKRAAFGQRTALYDIQNRYRNLQHDTKQTQTKIHESCSESISFSIAKSEKSFEACLKADDVMKTTELFLKKMQLERSTS